ncbi:MAG: hypothetical protein ABSG21_08140, partial [Spirochaetia bacterium]
MAHVRVFKWLGFAFLIIALVSFVSCGGSSKSSSSSSKSIGKSGGLPDAVFIEAMSQAGCSFDDIKKISGHKDQTTAQGYEIWRGQITF